jgi:hypothetical protein
MGEADDPKHPLWSTFEDENPPKVMYAGYYQGLTGRWLMTGVSYIEDTPLFICGQLDRPSKILKYELVEERDYPMDERMEYRRKKKEPVKVRQPKVRKPMRVRKPIGG